MSSHPDRAAATLANVPAIAAARAGRTFALPGGGARDARIDLKLLLWRAQAAAARSAAARTHLQHLLSDTRPDLQAGTVQDGVARGFAVALEEAVALAPALPAPPPPPDDPTRVEVVTGKELRKRKDLLVASAGPRIRFSRKEGVLFVDRDRDVHSTNCLRFEARAELGTLDGFVGREDERPRLFSAQFLQAKRFVTGAGYSELQLAGRLGRRATGFPCRVTFTGRDGEPRLRLRIAIDNAHRDHRLRVRFLGIPDELLVHECTDVRERVASDSGGFVAFTLVRACGVLLVDDERVAVPAAQLPTTVEHTFWLGST